MLTGPETPPNAVWSSSGASTAGIVEGYIQTARRLDRNPPLSRWGEWLAAEFMPACTPTMARQLASRNSDAMGRDQKTVDLGSAAAAAVGWEAGASSEQNE